MNKYLSLIFLCLFLFGIYIYPNSIYVSSSVMILLYYVLINKKNTYFLSILLISQLLFKSYYDTSYFIETIILILVILISIISKRNIIVSSIFCFIISILMYMILNKEFEEKDFISYVLYSLISAIFLFLLLYNNNHKYKFLSSYFIEYILAIFIILNIGLINYNLQLVIASYYIIYFTKNQKYLLCVSILMIMTLYDLVIINNNQSYILIIVAMISLLKKTYSLIITLLLYVLNLYFKLLDIELITYITLTTILFELFRSLLVINVEFDSFMVIENKLKGLTENMLNLAYYFETYATKYPENKNYLINLNLGVNKVVSSFCNNCFKKNSCPIYSKERYNVFKDMLIFASRKDIESIKELNEICPYYIDISKTTKVLSEKYNIDKLYNSNNRLVFGLLEVSNFLKKFCVDLNSSNLCDYSVFSKIKLELINAGIMISSFDLQKATSSDFVIDMCILNQTYLETKNIIEDIFNENSKQASCVYIKSKINKLYVKVVNKININVLVGVSKLKNKEFEASGDNYYIIDAKSKVHIALCDGMGKGDSAFNQSIELINMIKTFINIFETPEMVIDCASSLIRLRNYQDKFSTLDLLNINLNTNKCKLFKYQSASTYHIKKDKIIKYENNHLIVGVEENTESIEFSVEVGDIILLGSDGIFDNLKDENILFDYINQIKHLEIQKIANELITFVSNNKVKAKDDMIIIVAKIIKHS